MSKEKQIIEEMAKDLQETRPEPCEAWHCGGCSYEKYSGNNVCYDIQQAEKLQQKGYRKQEWVSVDERLPEESMTVITCNAKGEVDTDYYGYYSLGFSDKTVTHWMPLPEPPKGVRT